ncbi:hypothetical protein PO864_17830 [Providencia alcalifaciens]|uniref:Uncharacterized protein n=1 Tax=Providencia alcalifaciens 205/92 TaxID=1256988 RepID=A0AAV3M064_9GAMM|nr:hypothetical protein [Providencia alcalifaciens]EUD09166.1 hypothetical protein HMPREF1563_3317 [Providencia alcalifaciens 205/92]WGZ54069.1 hypothetical protein PO864_17830 [Providencia alcalifaciens]
MVCADCGGEVVWIGPITNLSHAECKQCGSVNNYLTEKVEDDVVSEANSMQLEADGEFVSFAGTDDVICSVASGSYDNDDRLAMLFAAAPEMLEALRELIQAHEYSLRIGYERIIELGGDCDSPELMINKDASLNKAKVAIAKATGK